MEDPESIRPQLMEDEDDGRVRSEDEEGEGNEGTRPMMRRAPDDPTQEEIDEHNVDHGVFRSWCPHCVKGRAAAYGHRKGKNKSKRLVPVVSIDYMFMTDRQNKEEESGSPILVIKDEEQKLGWAHVVPNKGRDNYAI